MGVLLRRGPSDLFQLLTWDLNTDEVTSGQWLSSRVHFERCDLSPNGKLLIYFAANYKPKADWQEHSYTAISRPPFFTALALWFKGPTYNGGGLFESDNSVAINDLPSHEFCDRFEKPKIAVSSFKLSIEETEVKRMTRDGWIASEGEPKQIPPQYPQREPRVMVKSLDNLEVTETFGYMKGEKFHRCKACIGGEALNVSASQVDIDAERRRIVYCEGGKLFANNGTSTKEIADLTNNGFEPVPPPDWANVWP